MVNAGLGHPCSVGPLEFPLPLCWRGLGLVATGEHDTISHWMKIQILDCVLWAVHVQTQDARVMAIRKEDVEVRGGEDSRTW